MHTFSTSSESSDASDNEFDDNEADTDIFTVARCRVMRVVGKINVVYGGVENICRERYGLRHESLDAMSVPSLPDRQTYGWISEVRWQKVMLLAAIDLLQTRVRDIRTLFATYKSKMPSREDDGDLRQSLMNFDDCVIEPQMFSSRPIEHPPRSDKRLVDFAKKRRQVAYFSGNFHNTFSLFNQILWSLFKLILLKILLNGDRQSNGNAITRILEKWKSIGLQECLKDDGWHVFQIPYPSNPGIAERNCVVSNESSSPNSSVGSSPESPARYQAPNTSPARIVSQNLEILVYFRSTTLVCTYLCKRLKSIERELGAILKSLGEFKDRRLRNCKPYSNRNELLHRVLLKEELIFEMSQIAGTSANRDECRAKRFMARQMLRIEKKAESILQRYVGWRRSREFPVGRSRSILTFNYAWRKKAVPSRGKVAYRHTGAGVIIRKFLPITRNDALIRNAFKDRQDQGLNVASIISFEDKMNHR